MLHELLTRPWWTFDPAETGGWGLAYRWFNLFEGAVWFALAILVLRRWFRHRHSRWEVAYAGAFLAFGLTDFREASVQTAALVVVKALNLAILIALRWQVRRKYYPESSVF